MAVNIGDFKAIDNSGKFLALAESAKQKALTQIAMAWDSYAAPMTPVDTGRLRNSRGYIVKPSKVIVGYKASYAAWVNNGTSRQRAQHFFEPSIMNHINEYKKIVESAYKNQ